ncbi:hypothetical protein ACRRTK_006519 [Alexandromys fortis]
MTFVKHVDKAFWYSSTFASVCATCQLFVETQPFCYICQCSFMSLNGCHAG